MAVLLASGAAAAGTLALSDAADGSNPIVDLQTAAADAKLFDFSEVGGVPFGVDVFCTLGGAGAIADVWSTRRA
jgi:hypothetical protein